MTLNVRCDSPDDEWTKVLAVYRGTDGWIEGAEYPSWYGVEGDVTFIEVSSEPSGLVFHGRTDEERWTGWLTLLCARLTLALGRPVHDACM